MPTPVFAMQNTGSFIFKVGRVGIDMGTEDEGGVYTGTMRSARISPVGEDGLTLFRRVALRIFHTSGFICELKVYVDGVQTQIYSGGVLTDQSVSFTEAAPTTSPAEKVIEAAINKRGTFVEFELTVDSDYVNGVFLVETVEVHHRPLRAARSDAPETS